MLLLMMQFIFLTLPCFAQDPSSNESIEFHQQNIIGAELWVADSSDSHIESQFGHSLLRFVTDSKNIFKDPVLSFEMLPPPGTAPKDYMVGAVTGRYPSIIKTMSLLHVLIYYSQQNNRGFKRMPLRLSKDQLRALVVTVNKVQRDQIKVPNYSFLGFNCARIVLWMLEQAGITVDGPNILLPTDLPERMRWSLLAPWQDITVPSGSQVMSQIEFVQNENQEISISMSELKKLSLKDIYILSVANYRWSDETRNTLQQMLQGFQADLADVYNLHRLEEYKYLSQKNCTYSLMYQMSHMSERERASLIENFIDPYVRLHHYNITYDNAVEQISIGKIIQKIKSEDRNNDLIVCYKKLTNQ